MAGLNGVRAYGLDGDELVRVAERVGAPGASSRHRRPTCPRFRHGRTRSGARPAPASRISRLCFRGCDVMESIDTMTIATHPTRDDIDLLDGHW